MAYEIHIEYIPGEKVHLEPLSVTATVSEVSIGMGKHVIYRLRYFYNTALQDVWLSGPEIRGE